LLLGSLVALSWAGCGGRYTTEEGSGGGLIGAGGNAPGTGGKMPGSGGNMPGTGGVVGVGGVIGVGGAIPGTGGSFPKGGTFGKGGSFPGTGGSVQCGKGFAFCNGVCVNVFNDQFNCGGCNVYCSDGFCSGGVCQPFCNGVNQSYCGGICVDIWSDPGNCGGCFAVCPDDSVCSGGICQPFCVEDGLTWCGAGCVDIYSDPNNCGGCGFTCGVNQFCDFAQCRNVNATFAFSGVRKNLPQSMLVGWEQCHAEPYSGNGTSLNVIQQKCYKNQLMLGCRTVGTSMLRVAANAPRGDVLYLNQSSVVHNANNVGWYYHTSRSWGFAPASATVSLSTCDIESVDGDRRLCWHTTNNAMQGGWRCGEMTGLNADSTFERVIFHAD